MNDRATKDDEVYDVEIKESDIVLPVSIEGMQEAWNRFQQVKKALLASDVVKYNKYGYLAAEGEEGKDYIVKSGWRKVSTAFNLSIDMNIGEPKKVYGEDGEGKYYTWLFPVRAIAPNGKYQDSWGACSSRKAFFSKKNKQRIDPQEEDIILMAQTVGVNRAISDLVGGGEVSGEEMIGKEHITPKPLMETNPEQALKQKQISSDYDLDPETYKLSGGKHVGKRMIDCDSNYIEWNIQQAKTSKFKQTFEKIPMDIWIEFLEVCLQIHIANKELKAKPVTDKDLELNIKPDVQIEGLESEFANIEDASEEDMEKMLLETFPGTVESPQSIASKHIKEVLK